MPHVGVVEEMELTDIPRRAALMFGALASTYVSGGVCVVARLRDAAQLNKREPYRDVVVYGRGRTFGEAFRAAEKHFNDGTPDWILDSLEMARSSR